DGLGLCGSQSECCCIFDHLIVLLFDKVPIDGLCENLLQVGIGIWFACFWSCETLGINIFESRHQLEAQQMTKPKCDLILPVSIHKLLLDLHLRTMTEYPLNHCRNLRRRTGFQL